MASWTADVCTAPGHIGCSSRGGPGSTTTVGLPGTTTPGAVPTGSITSAPAGTMACLRLAARTASKSPALDAGHQLLQDRRDLGLQLGVQHQFAFAEPRHGRNGHIVGGRPQAAAGDDQVHALGRQEAQLRLDVCCAVTADGDVGEFDAQLE